jgi:hypothetical protein
MIKKTGHFMCRFLDPNYFSIFISSFKKLDYLTNTD